MKILVLACFMMLSIAAQAQYWVGLGFGGHLNDVNFTNSEGVKDDRIQGVPGVYTSLFFQFDLGKGKRITDSRSALMMECGYMNGSSKNKESNLLETWALDYLSATVHYRFLQCSKSITSPYYGLGFSANYLVAGVQQEGFQQHDLTQELENLNLAALAEIGLVYKISEAATGNLGLAYYYGLGDLERGDQIARINGIKLGVSIFFKLSK